MRKPKSALIVIPDYTLGDCPEAATAPSAPTVYEPDAEQFTGLLDERGNKLMRPRNPIGFIAILLVGLSLTACGMLGGQPGGPGNTDAAISADGSMHYRSGKDFASIKGKFSRPDGLSGEFEAQGVDASKGLQIQAEAMKAQAEMVNKLLDRLAPLLERFAGGAAGLPGK